MKRLLSALALVVLLSTGTSARNAPPSHYNNKLLRVLVVKSEHRTFLFDDAGTCTGSFVNAVGRPSSPTHTGLRRVYQVIGFREAHSLGQRYWGDPNCYGPRIIDLGNPQALHGTDQPWRLGQNISEGCVRHRNEDIITIARHVHPGDRVAIVERMSDRHLTR